MERKTGEVVFAKPEGGWFLVRVGSVNSLEIYFLHQKFIKKGTECGVGYIVEFDAGPAKLDGQRPTALNAVVIDKAVSQ